MAHREEGSAYFYADYEKQGIRIISLSVPCGSDMEAEYPTPLWRFGDRQLKWLAEKALDTPGGWDVLVLCHVPFYSCYRGDMTTKLSVWTGDREAESYISALSGWIEDRQEAEEILRAYHEGVVYCNEEKDIHGNYTEKSAHIIACLSGHIHKDRLFAPGEQKGNDQNRLVCPQAAITSAKSSYNKETREKAEFGIAFDVLVLTPSEKCLSLIRFGDGEDRRIYYDSREEKK